MSPSLSIIIGIISGIIAYLVVSIFVKIFNGLVIPWYQTVIYRGIKIEGQWDGFYEKTPGREEPSYTVYLKQSGHKINGEILLSVQPTGKKSQKRFKLEGVFRDNNLILKCEAKDQTRLGMGSHVMKLVADGQRFKGSWLYIESMWGNVTSIEVFWVRNK